ncbi:MAG: hypothetical protein A3J93_04300 [Candidatus Magasanikbacteria bacterium RIFOXYC2_FULL_42_28]|uniref:Nudix hydrolase domain-containing protein n=1 Tax=Candidatus Magasanikbacteria bacterium RIFOXYC2_FULL_42_28 TaxID=1798704 RepID=A0A1F6NWZ1_9BACT|nr:MAG: hypothetical protein A3J93_04300 [Candidatus Magasanikbacteria bacterium RIFOXYC2_FULL_42_28]
MNGRYKKISEEIINKNAWWEYKRDLIELPDGTKSEYYYGESNGGALTVPILDDGRLVLVAQYRYLCDQISVEFPCGRIDDGEAPQAGAQRELLEESGYQSSNFLKVGSFHGSISYVKSPLHVFVADELTQAGAPEQSARETTEVIIRRVDEFEEMIKRGEIMDGSTLSAWALARGMVLKICESRKKDRWR